MSDKIRKINQETFQQGFKVLAEQMAGMNIDAFKSYLDGMGVTFAADLAGEFAAEIAVAYLRRASKIHVTTHGPSCIVPALGRGKCFCGVIDDELHHKTCPIAVFIHNMEVLKPNETIQ